MTSSIRWSQDKGHEPPSFGSSTGGGRRPRGQEERSNYDGTPGGTFGSYGVGRLIAASDLKPHGDNRLGDQPKAGVVVSGVPAHELVGLIDGDRVLVSGDSLGLFDDDP